MKKKMQTNTRWQVAPKIPSPIRKKLATYSDIVAQLLYNRGISGPQLAEKFLFAKQPQLHDPYLLPNIKKAAQVIFKVIKEKGKIYIYGDYDVDGVSASSILFDFLFRSLNANVVPYIPNRFEEGYGLSSIGLQAILKEKADLVITVDCGIRDRDLVTKFSKQGVKFIVTDHHSLPIDQQGKVYYPDKAEAVVHPGLPKSKYPFPLLSGTGVAWKLIQVLASEALKQGIIKTKPDINKYLDLVALATVCDCMDLVDENRILVKKGLEVMRSTRNQGLLELLNIAHVDPSEIDTYHLGFVLGPRLNAAGRVEHAMAGVQLLTSNDQKYLAMMADKLNKLNLHRQELTKHMLFEAEQQLIEREGLLKKLLFVYQEGWSEGVVGLVAGKITEKYHRPTLAASISGDVVKGSARSISGFNITEALAHSAEKLARFGGHAAAAGFTLAKANLSGFITDMQTLAEQTISDQMLIPQLHIDVEVTAQDFQQNLLTAIQQFKPFGIGNYEPTLLIKQLQLLDLRNLGQEKQHLKLLLKKGEQFIETIGFNMGDRASDLRPGMMVDVVGQMQVNFWNGKETLQLRLKDFKISA